MADEVVTGTYRQVTVRPKRFHTLGLMLTIVHAEHKDRIKYPVLQLHLDINVDYPSVQYDIQLLLLLHKSLCGDVHDAIALGV